MKNTRNVFIKMLVDEIIGKTRATAKQAYDEVMQFADTQEFKSAYKKWYLLHNTKNVDYNPVKHISLVLGKFSGKNNTVRRVV